MRYQHENVQDRWTRDRWFEDDRGAVWKEDELDEFAAWEREPLEI